MKRYEQSFRFLSFVYSVAFTAYVIWFLHHLLTGSATYEFLVGGTFVLLIIGFVRIFWTFKKWRESKKGKNITTNN